MGGAPRRSLEGTWWTARRTLWEHLTRAWPSAPGRISTRAFLDELRARAELAAAWSALDVALDALHLAHLRPADAQGAVAILKLVEPLLRAQRAAAMRPALESAAAWIDPRTGLAPWRATLTARRELARAHAHYRASLDALGGRFPWAGIFSLRGAAEATREAWSRDGARLVEGDRRGGGGAGARERSPCAAERSATFPPRRDERAAPDGVAKAWARAHLAALEARTPALTQRDAPTPWGGDDAAAQALTVRHDRAMTLAAQRVLARLDDAAVLRVAPAVKGRRRTVDQSTREAMLKECRKQRSVMPLRTFVRRFGDEGLLDALPVWLLSPETLSVLFAQAPLFDLVVFDEALQCTVESGLPVLLRARRRVGGGRREADAADVVLHRGGRERGRRRGPRGARVEGGLRRRVIALAGAHAVGARGAHVALPLPPRGAHRVLEPRDSNT